MFVAGGGTTEEFDRLTRVASIDACSKKLCQKIADAGLGKTVDSKVLKGRDGESNEKLPTSRFLLGEAKKKLAFHIGLHPTGTGN